MIEKQLSSANVDILRYFLYFKLCLYNGSHFVYYFTKYKCYYGLCMSHAHSGTRGLIRLNRKKPNHMVLNKY